MPQLPVKNEVLGEACRKCRKFRCDPNDSALVAFSGEVSDKESDPDSFTEHSHALNPNLKGRDIREAFKGDEYQILLVANKFQTGFDQPLLCGMYVDNHARLYETLRDKAAG
jgi:type I site-specific restriction-modification system R (restriction) subunit